VLFLCRSKLGESELVVRTSSVKTLSCGVLGLNVFLLELVCFGKGEECVKRDIELELTYLGGK
jgi:hypothetical protein